MAALSVAHGPRVSSGPERSEKLILLVDACAEARDVLELLLVELLHVRVAHAEDGDDILSRVRALLPNLIVLDTALAKNDGLELVRQLKGDASSHTIPLLVLTARTQTQQAAKAHDLGCDACIAIPVEVDEFLSQVQPYLARGE